MTQHYIVIGNPIAHSKSPEIHAQFATQSGSDISYRRQYCPDDASSFTAVIEAFFNGGGVGANVT
ncbi:MAG: shikimate dehydrogenase, partial [Psychrobacter sp.]